MIGRDASEAFESAHHTEEAREMLQAFYVGQYIDVSQRFPMLAYY